MGFTLGKEYGLYFWIWPFNLRHPNFGNRDPRLVPVEAGIRSLVPTSDRTNLPSKEKQLNVKRRI